MKVCILILLFVSISMVYCSYSSTCTNYYSDSCYYCNTYYNTCYYNSSCCTSNSDCSTGYYCSYYSCVYNSSYCTSSSSCSSGYYCSSSSHSCVYNSSSSYCSSSYDCNTGYYCSSYSCVRNSSYCTSSSNCSSGYYCSSSSHSCVYSSSSSYCYSNSDCGSGYYCSSYSCVYSGSGSSSDSSSYGYVNLVLDSSAVGAYIGMIGIPILVVVGGIVGLVLGIKKCKHSVTLNINPIKGGNQAYQTTGVGVQIQANAVEPQGPQMFNNSNIPATTSPTVPAEQLVIKAI